ncbi:MAG: hypothetical protein ABI689_00695 [Thermoanaerobaculia bacterium]
MKNRPESSSANESAVGEDDLILHYYGESGDPQRLERALATDAHLRQRYTELKRDLDATAGGEIPEPPADLAGRVWRELRPRLARRRTWRERLFAGAGSGWSPGWGLATAALGIVAALAIGYLAGRQESGNPAGDAAVATGLSPAARERLLLASVESHLAGSERLLTRVTNAAPTDTATLAEESAWAEALVSANRLYRRAAERSGQRRIVALLDELEPLLLELAHSEGAAPDDLAAAQQRIEHTDLLFKLRVTGERLQRDAGASRSTKQNATRNVS